jgi:hypothetical protein
MLLVLKSFRNLFINQLNIAHTILVIFWCVWLAGADPNLRDWSGRKPRQYQVSQDTSVSADTFRSEYFNDRLSRVRHSINHSPAANNTLPRIQKPRLSHLLLRRSFLPSDRKKRRDISLPTLHKWISHLTGIINFDSMLVKWIIEIKENWYSLENFTLFWGCCWN